MNACYYTENADLLIHNAKIYTVDNQFAVQEAMAVKDGIIIDIGPNNELKNRYRADQIIDAQLMPIYPGFIDAHCHFLWYGNSFFEVDLIGTKSWEEVIERVQTFAKNHDEVWIKGHGWDQNDWKEKGFPNKEILDSLFPDQAVFLSRIDKHAAIVNQKALDLAGVKSNATVDGGVFELINGELSGLLIDNAITVVADSIPGLTEERMRKSLLIAQEKSFAVGLTTVSDAMLENKMVHAIENLQQSGELKMNVYGMLVPSDENKAEYLENGPYLTDKLTIRAFKYFADGALGSRGAKLIHPYTDDHKNSGLFLVDSNYLETEAIALKENGFQMNTHCIGDGANRMVLTVYAKVLGGTNDKRWRIEHAQIVAENDFAKFKDFTIIPSVQPTHATSDMDWASDRLGSERIKNAYAFKRLMEANGLIALGTDSPIEDINPLKTFYAATIRKSVTDPAENGFQMENALSREEALKGMTVWAAIANFEEERKGSIEIGKVADFVMLNQDIMQIEESAILRTEVLATYVRGECVYQKK